MIAVTNFRKEYPLVTAADDICFQLPSGTVGALIGPNGAGKTTTMRTLSGIIRPTSGELIVAGFDVVKSPIEVKKRIAYVPDDPPLFESLTVWEHLQFIASAYSVPQFESSAEQLLEQFELTGKRTSPAGELSRGMRQKVAIACAYLRNPQVILLDEPLTGLDPAAIRLLKQSVKERAAAGATVLVSSHLLALVEDITQHLVIMRSGRCLFSGTLAEAQQTYGVSGSLEDVFFRAVQPAELASGERG
ncbi:MAG: ABC transporter ATP-binding protein [Pirellulales bacterium]